MTRVSKTQRRCDSCGAYTFFNYSVSSWDGDGFRHTHGDCEKAANALRELPIRYDHAIQALVEISELCGRHVSATDDEEYVNPERLLAIVHAVYAEAADGYSVPSGQERESA